MKVTAIINGWEIGLGQGDSATYAIEECIDSIESIYLDESVIGDVELVLNGTGGSTYPKYMKLTEVFYKERQYF